MTSPRSRPARSSGSSFASGNETSRFGGIMSVDNKTLEISIKLWTDDIAAEKGQVEPKHAWSSGTVQVRANRRHGIPSTNPVPFNTFAELPQLIEKLLLKEGVKLHLSSKAKKSTFPRD